MKETGSKLGCFVDFFDPPEENLPTELSYADEYQYKKRNRPKSLLYDWFFHHHLTTINTCVHMLIAILCSRVEQSQVCGQSLYIENIYNSKVNSMNNSTIIDVLPLGNN